MVDPKGMLSSRINRELDRIDKHRSELTAQFIKAGRGEETREETRSKSDALSAKWNKLIDRHDELIREVARRVGKSMSRIPRGIGVPRSAD